MPGPTTLLEPTAWAVTVGLTSALCITSNPSRFGIVFVNNGPVAVAICPATVIPVVGGVPQPPIPGVAAIGGPGSITMQPGDKFIIDNLPCSASWNAIAAGAGGVLTILEHP